MGNGWIKLHRKLQLKGYYTKSQYVHLWVHLLLSANHKPAEYMTNGKIILIKEGQLLTGRKQLSMGTGIPESTVEDILKLLENEHQIQQQKTTKYRLITIVNWKCFQEPDNKATTKQQQADTNKNEKNEKNTGALEDETRVVEVSLNEGEEKPKRKRKVTPEMEEVFALFSDNPARFQWPLFENQRVAAGILHQEFGMEELTKRYAIAKKYRDQELCPLISNPSQFLEKMPNMERFLKTLES